MPRVHFLSFTSGLPTMRPRPHIANPIRFLPLEDLVRLAQAYSSCTLKQQLPNSFSIQPCTTTQPTLQAQ